MSPLLRCKSTSFLSSEVNMSASFQMLLNLHKKSWVDGLSLQDYNTHCNNNEKTVKEMLDLAKNYHKVSNNMRCNDNEKTVREMFNMAKTTTK